MAISKRWIASKANCQSVLKSYRSRELPTIAQIAKKLGTTHHTVTYVLQRDMPVEERKALAKIRYSASKTGPHNPMTGLHLERHPRWKGDCEDGRGYLTRLFNNKRHFAHHVVMMEALGITVLPATMEVHHIDENPKNNALDNLALTTKKGHRAIHYLQKKDSLAVQLKKSTIADALKYMT